MKYTNVMALFRSMLLHSVFLSIHISLSLSLSPLFLLSLSSLSPLSLSSLSLSLPPLIFLRSLFFAHTLAYCSCYLKHHELMISSSVSFLISFLSWFACLFLFVMSSQPVYDRQTLSSFVSFFFFVSFLLFFDFVLPHARSPA